MRLLSLRRRSLSGAAVLLGALAAVACQGPTPAKSEAQTLSFRQRVTNGDQPEERVEIIMEEGTGRRITRLYSLITASNGRPLSESLWDQAHSGQELQRDWKACTQHEGEPQDEIPASVQQALDSVIGPSTPPQGAERLAPNRWRIGQGRAVLTVQQTGDGQTDRIVTLGIPSAPESGTVMDQIALRPGGAHPDLLPDWKTCQPAAH